MVSFYIFDPLTVANYNLDFYLLIVTILIEMFIVLIRLYYRQKIGSEDLGLGPDIRKKKEINVDKMQSVDSARNSGKGSNRIKGSDRHKKGHKFGSLRKDKPQRKNSDSQSSIPSGLANSLSTNQQVVLRRRIF
jgi:hypothetical protein